MANGLRVAHIPPKIQGWRVFFWVVGLGLGNIGCLCHKKLFWNSCSFKIQNISKNCVFMFFSWYCFFGSNISNQNDSSMDPNVQTHTGGMPYTVLSVPCDERNAKFRTSPKWIKAASTCQMCSWKFLSRTLNFCTQCNYYYRRYQDRVDAFLSLTLVSFPMTLLGIKKTDNLYHQYITHWFSHKRAWVSSSKKILNACLLGACKETILPPTCRNKSRKWLTFCQVLRFHNLILLTNSRNVYHTHAKFVWRNSSKVLVQWGKCTGM